MSMKTPAQLAEKAARAVIKENRLAREKGEASISALGWALGEGIEYELGLVALVTAAIDLDRAQRGVVHADFMDDQENVRGADYVDVDWTAYRAGGIIFQSDMRLTAAQAVGMFQGIGEAANA